MTLTQRSLDGALVSTGEAQFGVSINPVTFAAFSTLDDGETEDVNEFEVLLGNGPVDAAGGRATVFVHSFNRAAQVVLTVTAQDPQTGETVSGQQTFTIASGATGLPGSVVIDSGNEAVYVQGVNGATSKSVEVFVIDAAGGFAQSPAAGVNNIQLEIVGGAQGGERLQSIGANGQSQSGSLVRFASNNGVGNATYASGTRSGTLTLRATSDRADNNVDNGIQDGVTSTRALSVSDGQLFDLDIASPANVVASTAVSQSPTSAQAYEMDVAIVATDRFGNPVPPGTEIRFGLIDEPQSNGAFLIAGGDGNPQENGTTFTAPGGAFTTAAGGVGPNDTLVVFGEERPQDRDLENIRTVQQVVNATTLTVQNRFNRNDDTGTSVDNGPVLPYVIGRAVDGNVRPTASTDSSGVARVTVTYPISKLGKRMVLWAQANATPVSTPGETAGDAEVLRFQAAGPLEISAPTGVQGNRTVGVPVCLEDAFGNGVSGVRIGYVVSLTQGSASIDGSAAAAGTLATVTGFDGCAIASVTTSGITQAGTRRNDHLAGRRCGSGDRHPRAREPRADRQPGLVPAPGRPGFGGGFADPQRWLGQRRGRRADLGHLHRDRRAGRARPERDPADRPQRQHRGHDPVRRLRVRSGRRGPAGGAARHRHLHLPCGRRRPDRGRDLLRFAHLRRRFQSAAGRLRPVRDGDTGKATTEGPRKRPLRFAAAGRAASGRASIPVGTRRASWPTVGSRSGRAK